MSTKQDVTVAKKALLHKLPKTPIKSEDFLNTGSTLLNLACTGRRLGGFIRGHYFFIVGDSASGKTFLSLTCFAEASINRHFDDYRFIFDAPEEGALMDMSHFFGQKVADRIEPPQGTKLDPIFSSTIEEFFYNLDDAFKEDVPFIYVLDSHDALDSEEDEKKFQEKKSASRKGKKTTGSFGTMKPKVISANIRKVIQKLKRSGSILIIISQTRDRIGFGSQYDPKTRSGGHALKFYSHLEIWSSIRQRIRKNVGGKPRQIGIVCRAQVKKNRITGREREVNIPIYHSVGFDDIGSLIAWLIEEKHWKGGSGEEKKGKGEKFAFDGKVDAPEFKFKGPIPKLIEKIEKENKEKLLRKIVADKWDEIETSLIVKRKRRYG